MSFKEVNALSERTQLLPTHNKKEHQDFANEEYENLGLSFSKKLQRFATGVGKPLLVGLSVVSTILVVVLLSINTSNSPSQILLLQQAINDELTTQQGDLDYIVDTSLGKVEGRVLSSRDGRDYYGFYKMPFAKPPVGRLRFKHPEPAEKWEGLLSESEGPLPCKQAENSKLNFSTGVEDCLYLNLFTPKFPTENQTTEELLPVMIYIYGGGFMTGTCNTFSPEYIMDEDVIFALFQHRLGPFGFLNTGDGQIPGNMGFHDQVMAIKWIKDNVQAFGGDPNKIMIIGSSSGSMSLNALMVSPMAEGLFQRALGISGVSITSQTLIKDPLTVANYIGNRLNCSTKSTRRLARCLRNADAEAITAIPNSDVMDETGYFLPYSITLEKIDDPNDLSQVFMPDSPYNLMKDGKINKIPYILGNVMSEQLKESLKLLNDVEMIDQLNTNWTEAAPTNLNWQSSAFNKNDMSNKIHDFYFGDNNIGNETWRNLTDLMSDHFHMHPAYISASWFAFHNKDNVYLYYFTKEVTKSYANELTTGRPDEFYGPTHGDDNQFLFHYTDGRFPYIDKNSTGYEFSKKIIKMWVQFAKTGKPITPEGMEEWTPIQPGSTIKWLNIDDNMKMTDIILPRMTFWDQFSPEDLYYV